MTLGSRGDMEPYLALGEELKENGYEVGFYLSEQTCKSDAKSV